MGMPLRIDMNFSAGQAGQQLSISSRSCSGMIVFKLERERPAFATHGSQLYYIKVGGRFCGRHFAAVCACLMPSWVVVQHCPAHVAGIGARPPLLHLCSPISCHHAMEGFAAAAFFFSADHPLSSLLTCRSATSGATTSARSATTRWWPSGATPRLHTTRVGLGGERGALTGKSWPAGAARCSTIGGSRLASSLWLVAELVTLLAPACSAGPRALAFNPAENAVLVQVRCPAVGCGSPGCKYRPQHRRCS